MPLLATNRRNIDKQIIYRTILKNNESGLNPIEITQIGSLSATQFKYVGGVLAPNKKIYAAPSTSAITSLLEIDTESDTVTTFGSVSGTWYGGCLARNGLIYFVPSANSPILVLNPITKETFTLSGTVLQSYGGGGISPKWNNICPTKRLIKH